MQRYAAASGIPDALLSCHRYDEILPPGAIQSCHLNESALDCQIQRTAAVLWSEQQAVRCGLPVIRPEPRNLEILVSALSVSALAIWHQWRNRCNSRWDLLVDRGNANSK